MKIVRLQLDAGRLSLDIEASDGEIQIEVSNNLSSWDKIGVVTVVNGAGRFSETIPDTAQRRFYRLRL